MAIAVIWMISAACFTHHVSGPNTFPVGRLPTTSLSSTRGTRAGKPRSSAGSGPVPLTPIGAWRSIALLLILSANRTKSSVGRRTAEATRSMTTWQAWLP